MKTTMMVMVASLVKVSAATVSLTATNLNNPTQAELQAGHTVSNFAGFNGLTLSVTTQGNHDNTISPNVNLTQFANSMPTVNVNSEPGYRFSFDGGGSWNVVGLSLTSSNNIFSRNVSSTGFSVREAVSGILTGGTWDSLSPVPGGNTGQLQLNGIGNSTASISINLPNQTQQNFDTSGFTAEASGSSITEFEYIYDVLSVSNAGQAPANLETNQPFSIDIEVIAVPEPSSAILLGFGVLGIVARRRRN